MASATFAGTDYALKATPKVGTWPNAASCNGELYCLSEEFYATGAHAAGSLLYMGILPAGAVVHFSFLWPIDSDEVADGAAVMAAAVTGELGTLTDPDLFGDFTTLAAVTPVVQILTPVPDGVIHTFLTDTALRAETIVVIKTADQSLADTEGIALKMFYTLAGRTY